MHCQKHNKPNEFICYKCSCLMCSKCMFIHNNKHYDHVLKCDYIDNIKQSAQNIFKSNIENNNNSDNNNEEDDEEDNYSSYINQTVSSLWNKLKSTSLSYQSLLSNENDIHDHFKLIHEYIAQQEYKLIKQINENKDIMESQSENIINNIKYLNTIINHCNNLINDSNKNKCNNESNDNNTEISDTTDLYSISSVMKSINKDHTLQSFMNDNNNTLFNNINNDCFDIKQLINQYNNDTDSIILHLIMKYNDKYQNDETLQENNNNIDTFTITKQPFETKQLESIIDKSIKMETLKSESTSTSINEPIKTKYIFSSHRDKGATLINTSNNNSIEQLHIDYEFYGLKKSMVAIGEYIYVFGDLKNKNKWMKYSVKSKSIEHIGDINGTDGDSHISVCYDGQDHIYLVNGFNVNRIDRFNIKTMQFERFHRFLKQYGIQESTMIYNDKLYSIPFRTSIMIEFDLENKTTLEHKLEISVSSACHDNNGNFYIHSCGDNAEFNRYNVISKQTTKLNPIPSKEGWVFICYQFVSSDESYIYSFGGVRFGNFKYSIERNQSEAFLENEKYERNGCGSLSIELNLSN